MYPRLDFSISPLPPLSPLSYTCSCDEIPAKSSLKREGRRKEKGKKGREGRREGRKEKEGRKKERKKGSKEEIWEKGRKREGRKEGKKVIMKKEGRSVCFDVQFKATIHHGGEGLMLGA